MPGHWWDGQPDQNLWMEITRRPDIGGDLKAPIEARGGRSTAGYALLESVVAGDLIVLTLRKTPSITLSSQAWRFDHKTVPPFSGI